jgi:hypothetical protein
MEMADEKEQIEDSSSSTLSRKRTRDADGPSSMTTPSVTDLSLDDASDNTREIPSIKSLSLEAIFHPKFENESQNDQSIRRQMSARVLDGKGYVEVSLKHSGSLLLWSGGQRYYSKNSTENPFTYVGEVLLRQHFYRAFYNCNATDEQDSSTTATLSMEAHYQQCSDYVQENRLTLAFEVVTAILGHHGDIPNRDFLILTAVADRNKERFYSTCQLVEFAQRFRLPHNDTWVFDSERGVQGLFHLYDTTRETGLAEDTVAALNDIADMHVSSMYPHVDFQGNILEGIVIRYVPYHDRKKEQETMRGLAAESQRILQVVPPETPSSFVLTKALVDGPTPPAVLTTDIREISRDIMASGERSKVESFLATSIGDVLSSSDNNSRRSVDRAFTKEWTSKLTATFKQALSNEKGLDTETQRILNLMEALDRLKAKVEYRIVKESTAGQPDRWLCIVHVFFDATHKKFRQRMEDNDMELFRGFCIELGTEQKQDTMKVDDSTDSITAPVVDAEASGLMLKMKFLPYMVRTFGCRNGLDVVAKRGPQAFTEYTTGLMTRWGMSLEAKAKWQPFFSAWGKYAHMCLTQETHEYSNASLPKLCDSFYLDHLEHFTSLFERGEIDGIVEEQSSSTSTFRGLIFVIGLDHDKANLAADTISEKLGGLVVRKGLKGLAPEDWDASCLTRRVGMVCSVSGQDPTKGVRKKIQDHGDGMFAVIVGCDEVSILSQFDTVDKTKGDDKVAESAVSAEKHEADVPLQPENIDTSAGEDKSTVSADHEVAVASQSEKVDKPGKNKVTDPKVAARRLGGQVKSWRDTRFAKLWEISDFDFFQEKVVDSDEDGSPIQEDNVLTNLVDELSRASAALPKLDHRPGLLVFFPGIPGSGKSTLCSQDTEDEIRRIVNDSAETEMSNGVDKPPPRPVIIRVGDEVKKKYWPLVKVEKTKQPSSVYVADKNAPPVGWTSVAQVCSITNGIAVPVLPDAAALQTTSVEGAGQYPFSLHYLAVCMTRVMTRPPQSHSGKLDRSLDVACMIVVKFFSLYRGIAASELLPTIQRAIQRGGATLSSTPITVPFFAQEDLPDLPSDLEDALNDAIRIQVRFISVLAFQCIR